MQEETLETLLAHCRVGRDFEREFSRLFYRFHDRVYCSFPARIRPQVRSELTQEVFFKVYRNMDTCPTDGPGFKKWLHRIARNTFLTWLQQEQRHKRRGTEVPLIWTEGEESKQLPIEDPQTLELLIAEEDSALLWRAIEELPPQMRHCVQLRVDQELSYSEIARVLGLSPGTVKAHVHAARIKLRAALSERFRTVDLQLQRVEP